MASKALRRYRRQLQAEHDAQTYLETDGYPDLYEWAGAERAYPELD